MKLSTRSRYGIRLMFELALGYSKRPIMLKEIAKNQDISEKYLSKLVIPLKGAGLINSIRGAHGGYMLAHEPAEITVFDIVELLEGNISLVECVDNSSICNRVPFCPTRYIWTGLDETISKYLKGITLDEILKNYSMNKGENQFMYTI